MSQGGEVDSRKRKLSIKSDSILLVEGRDEVNLFNALIKHLLRDTAAIQVIEAGGVYKFPGSLEAIKTAAQARPKLRSIGVIRDADDDPAGAFQSVCNHLRDVGYKAPESHGKFSDALPSVGVFIVPDGVECGAIETLLRSSLNDVPAAMCIEQYLQCLKEHGAMNSTNADKSFAHAYLAATKDPMARVGEGARQGVWNFDAPAFRDLTCFLRELSSGGN